MTTSPEIAVGPDCGKSAKTNLKPLEESLQKLIHQAFASGGANGQKIKNFLNGTWLGEPFHVVVTDIPIGA